MKKEKTDEEGEEDEDYNDDQNHLGIVEMTEMVILVHREERATLLSLEAPFFVLFFITRR